jgi:sugar lactone lactonase YvrE
MRERLKVKKALILLLLATPLLAALVLNWSCSAKTPTAATNFQNPVQTIAAINPTLTFTPTFTFTPTYTFTPTGTPTGTFTPYVTATPWTGFNNPSGVAVDASGNVYVADTGNNKVGKYTPNGLLVANWGAFGIKGKVPYTGPVGVAVDASSNLYVVGGTNQIAKFGPAGNLVTSTFSTSLTFLNPQGVAVDGSGNIYVSDTGNNRIVQLNSSGNVTGFTGTGSGGVLSLPASTTIGSVTITSAVTLSGIAVYNGIVYVATQGTGVNGSTYSSVLGFDTSTGNTTTLALPGFVNPSGIAFDSNGNLYVADTGNKQVEEFMPNAGSFTLVPLAFNNSSSLQSPKGVAVSPAPGFNIYVSDSALNEVVEFTP